MTTDEILPAIRTFVEKMAANKGVRHLNDTDSLTEEGIVDSLGIFALVAFLEEHFGVRFADDEIIADHFQSIEALHQIVAAKCVNPKH